MGEKRADELQAGDLLGDGRVVVEAVPVQKSRYVDLTLDDGERLLYAPDYVFGVPDADWRDVALAELAADPVVAVKVAEVVDRVKPDEVIATPVGAELAEAVAAEAVEVR